MLSARPEEGHDGRKDKEEETVAGERDGVQNVFVALERDLDKAAIVVSDRANASRQ